MQTLTFIYTKENSSVSTRTLLAQVLPSEDYAGIDISDLDPNEAQAFIDATKEAYAEYLEKLIDIQLGFDLKHNFRRFKANRMTNINKI